MLDIIKNLAPSFSWGKRNSILNLHIHHSGEIQYEMKIFNSQHLIIPQSPSGQDFVLRNCNTLRCGILQATFKKAIFLSHNRFSFILCGFSTDCSQGGNPAQLRLFLPGPWLWCFKHCWEFPVYLSRLYLFILKVIFSLTFPL